jgi:mannosyltransferase OCH1-like enzyme
MIEKNIHQIWVGPYRIPKHIREYMNCVRDNHTDFTYYLWDNDNIPDLPDNIREIYDSYDHPAIKADLLRMYVVYIHGGVYLDVDFKYKGGLYNNININSNDGIIVYNSSYQTGALANSFFAFKKESPVLKYMLDNVTHKNQWIGPNWWAQTIYRYMDIDINTTTLDNVVDVLNRNNIFALSWADLEKYNFIHDPMASWIDGSIWNKLLNENTYD